MVWSTTHNWNCSGLASHKHHTITFTVWGKWQVWTRNILFERELLNIISQECLLCGAFWYFGSLSFGRGILVSAQLRARSFWTPVLWPGSLLPCTASSSVLFSLPLVNSRCRNTLSHKVCFLFCSVFIIRYFSGINQSSHKLFLCWPKGLSTF